MQKLFKWFLMLNKRLYKKKAFLAILFIIPVLLGLFSNAAKKESGFLKIALVQENPNDTVSLEIVNSFLSEESLINFKALDADKALKGVENGEFDAAWIFPENMEEKIGLYTQNIEAENKIVRVIQREDNVFLRLSREKLSAALYKYCASSYYINFSKAYLAELNGLSNSELMEYFNGVSVSENLFAFESLNQNNNQNKTNYLTAPVRGLLSLLVLICAMAAVLIFMQDIKTGTFSLVKQNRLVFVAFACSFIAALNIAAVTLIALLIMRLSVAFFVEVVAALLYALCCASFCLLLKQIFTSIKLYSVVIVLLTVIMASVCPVFFEFKKIYFLKFLFPPTYYINIYTNSKFLIYMLLYFCVTFLISILLDKIKRFKYKSF